MPQRHQGTKEHQELVFYGSLLVALGDFVPWWQKKILPHTEICRANQWFKKT